MPAPARAGAAARRGQQERHQARTGDPVREHPTVHRRDHAVFVPADHQGGHLDRAEERDAGPRHEGERMEHRSEHVRPRPKQWFGQGQKPVQWRDAPTRRSRTNATRRRDQNQATNPGRGAEGKLLRHRPTVRDPTTSAASIPSSSSTAAASRASLGIDIGRRVRGLRPTPGASKLISVRPVISWVKGRQLSNGRVIPLSNSTGSPAPATRNRTLTPATSTRPSYGARRTSITRAGAGCGRVDGDGSEARLSETGRRQTYAEIEPAGR